MVKGELVVHIVDGKDVRDTDSMGHPDVFVKFGFPGEPMPKEWRTETRNNTVTPLWDTRYYLTVDSDVDNKLAFQVLDSDFGGDEHVASVEYDFREVYEKLYMETWIELDEPYQREKKTKIRVIWEWFPNGGAAELMA